MSRNNRGYTLVETLVGFTLLAILMASFVGIFKFASNISMEAIDRVNARESFEREYYKETSDLIEKKKLNEAVLVEIDENGNPTGVEIDFGADFYKVTDKSGEYGYIIYILDRE